MRCAQQCLVGGVGGVCSAVRSRGACGGRGVARGCFGGIGEFDYRAVSVAREVDDDGSRTPGVEGLASDARQSWRKIAAWGARNSAFWGGAEWCTTQGARVKDFKISKRSD